MSGGRWADLEAAKALGGVPKVCRPNRAPLLPGPAAGTHPTHPAQPASHMSVDSLLPPSCAAPSSAIGASVGKAADTETQTECPRCHCGSETGRAAVREHLRFRCSFRRLVLRGSKALEIELLERVHPVRMVRALMLVCSVAAERFWWCWGWRRR